MLLNTHSQADTPLLPPPSAAPVVLDPNTAHGSLSVSADLTSVVCLREPQVVPPNPDRFLHMRAVLGQELCSGKHCWDVDVRGAQYWILGVVRVECLGFACQNFAHGGLYYLAKKKYWDFVCGTAPHHINLKVKEKPDCIRVTLDLDRGKLSFSDAERKTHLRTLSIFPRDLVHPIFWPLSDSATLRVLPVSTVASVQKAEDGKKSSEKKPAKRDQQQDADRIAAFALAMQNMWDLF